MKWTFGHLLSLYLEIIIIPPIVNAGWIWLPEATCSWNETGWCSIAKLLCPTGSAGSTRPALRWTRRSRSRATTPASNSHDAAAGLLMNGLCDFCRLSPVFAVLYAWCRDNLCCVLQMLPMGHVYHYPPSYPPSHNMRDVPLPGVAGGMLTVNYDMGGLPIRDATGLPMPNQPLATALANASPEQQRTVRPLSCFCFNTSGLSSHCFRCTRNFSYLTISREWFL